MDIKQLREAAGITASYNASRKQQLTEQVNALTKRIDTEPLTEEQLDELLGGLGALAKQAWGNTKQAVGAGVEKAAGYVNDKAAAIQKTYQQGEKQSTEQKVAKAVTMLAKLDQAKWGPVLQMIQKVMAQQPQQQAQPVQAKPKVTPQQAAMSRQPQV